MSRHLEPMKRIDEFGNSSVPVGFADDAVSIRTMLRQSFASERMNRVNLRRKFFCSTPERVFEVQWAHKAKIMEWRQEAAERDPC